MPGYNVTGPAEAFSSGLEDFLAKRQAQEMLRQRMALEQQEAQRRAQMGAQDIALRQQEMAQRQAEFADRVRSRESQDVVKSISTMQRGDIPSADIAEKATRIGMGHLFEGPKESLPGIAAVPLVSATDESGQPLLPPEASAQRGITPSSALPKTFKGLPAERKSAERTQEVQSLMDTIANAPPGSPESRQAIIRYEMTLERPLTSAEAGTAGAGRIPEVGSFGAQLLRIAPEGDTSKITPEMALTERQKWANSARPGADSSLPPDAVDMEAWRHITTGRTPNARSVGGQGNYTAIASRMAELRREFDLPENLASNEATYKGLSSALTFQTKMAESAKNAARTATDNLELARKASPNVSRTDSAFVNARVNDFLRGTTSAVPLTDFETKIYIAVREYAKVATSSSASVQGLSDTATSEAVKLLNSAQAPDAFNAAINAMQADMKNIIDNHDKTIEEIRGKIGTIGKAPGAGSSGSGGKSTLDTPVAGYVIRDGKLVKQ